MGILGGAMTVRRFRVFGDVPDGFRDLYRERLAELAFHDPPNEPGKEVIEGWVCAHNLLETDFSDLNRWLYDPWVLLSLRMDQKALPARLLRATVDRECAAWASEKGVDRCPASIRTQIKERIEDEWLRRTLPRVRVAEVCWNVAEKYVLIGALSETIAERVRKRFFQTFGMRLVPWSPLDWLTDATTVEHLLALPPSVLNAEEGP